MKKKLSYLLNLFVVLSMILALFAAGPSSALAGKDQAPPTPEAPDTLADVLPKLMEENKQPIEKIDPGLRDAVTAGDLTEVTVAVTVKGNADLSNLLKNMMTRPPVLDGVTYVFGVTSSANLAKIAALKNVISIVDANMERADVVFDQEIKNQVSAEVSLARIQQLKANEKPYAETAAAQNNVKARGWFDVLDGHKSGAAWKKGFTGVGVRVGVIDDGIDFSHPDLMGTFARVTDENSPYYGWPMAFSQLSTYMFASDVLLDTDYTATGMSAGRWADTRTTVSLPNAYGQTTVTTTYKPLGSGVAHTYTIPATSASDTYKLGSFPERHLLELYGERPAVLVVDEGGYYDTVYVDLDNDYDFTDEKPATIDSPEIYRDMDGDGYTDISGGILAWISDGANVPPAMDWLWGLRCSSGISASKSNTQDACPTEGNLVIFAGSFSPDYSHGTQCASNVAAQGKVSGGLTAQPFAVGGMVQGAAPDAQLVDFGDYYYSTIDDDNYLVAAYGFDGVRNSGDEVQVTSNSYGAFGGMWGGFGTTGQYITAINKLVSPSTVYVFSGGNEGPGYGPQEGSSGSTIIKAGTSTQFGSTNWDSISGIDQIVYGDPSSFGSKGPNNDGSAGLDVLGNGGRGAGDESVNYHGYNGVEAWDTWGGTSRSAPVVAGNLALIYQAYKARHGVWPSWDDVMAIVKSGATNSVSSPFLQGAGVVNSDRATDLAAGIYGVIANPSEWDVGDMQAFDNFPKVAFPGETYVQEYTLTNPSGKDISVDVTDGVMKLINKQELTFTTSDPSEESAFNFHAPDYLMQLDETTIPADTEVMVVRYVHPYDTFDTSLDFTANPNSSWRFLLYNWTDKNGDGDLWEDADGNGVVNHQGNGEIDNEGFERLDFDNTEIEQGEYVRMDYEFGGLGIPIYVHDPLERMGSGYFFGFQHRYNDGSVPQTTFKIGVEFYKRADWDWLSVDAASVDVPAFSDATFNATAVIPEDAIPGSYEGVIFVKDWGDGWHAAHESALPVVVNIGSTLKRDFKALDANTPLLPVSLTFGGGAMADTMFQNSWSNGYFNWYGGGWQGAGDWRKFFFDVHNNTLGEKNLLVHTSWEDAYPTDYNTFVLGPTDALYAAPYTLGIIGQSEPFYSGAAYAFNTSTDGPDDWLVVPMSEAGRHQVALHNVLYAGEELASQFKVDVGTIDLSASIDPAKGKVIEDPNQVNIYGVSSGQVVFNFTPTLELPDLDVTLAGGLSKTRTSGTATVPPEGTGTYSAWAAGNIWVPVVVDEFGATQLEVYADVPVGEDVDMFLVYDANDDGQHTEGVDTVVGSSGNSTGTDEQIIISDPALGTYWIVLDGYTITIPAGVPVPWYADVTAPGDLSADHTTVVSTTVVVDQDTPLVPTSGSYHTTVTTDNRTASIEATLYNISATADLDLYLLDDSNNIVAKSQMTGNLTETLMLSPEAGEYRLPSGETYTLWVHGYSVPAAPITPTLKVWKNELNIWLEPSTDPDVTTNALEAGESVPVTVNFDKSGWTYGDDDLTFRLLAEPSVLPNAFDELIALHQSDEFEDAWSNVKYSLTASAPRGEIDPGYYIFNRGDANSYFVAPGDEVEFTFSVENGSDVGMLLTPFVPVFNFLGGSAVDAFTFKEITDQPSYGDTYTGTVGFDDVVVYWEGTIPAGETISVSFTAVADKPTYSALGDWGVFGLREGTMSNAYIFQLDPEAQGVMALYEYTPYDSAYLDLSKQADTGSVLPGETFSYQIEATNYSAEDKAFYFEDALPADVTLVSAPGLTYDAATHTLSWTANVPGDADTPTTWTVTVQVNDDVPYASEIENTVTMSDKLGGEALMEASDTVDVSYPEVSVDKSVDKVTGVLGEKVKYTITIQNHSAIEATGLSISDVLPAYLDVDETTLSANATLAGGVITWEGDLAANATEEVTFEATINEDASYRLALINGVELAFGDNMVDFSAALTEIHDFVKAWMPFVSMH